MTLIVLCLVKALVVGGEPVRAAQTASTWSMPERGPAPVAAPDSDAGPIRQLVADEWHDYVNFISWSNAEWLGVGGLAALAVHPADGAVHESVVDADRPSLPGGNAYGSQTVQVPVAIVWWIAGHAAGSERDAAAGRDLLRAQVAVFSWTNAIKWATGRVRPNGDPRSFPSGHASASFATAVVLQEHYGWKLGLPAFAAAAYTAASRVTADEHWLSDVVFGATLGMVCSRTVTVRLRQNPITVSPAIDRHRIAVVFRPSR